MSPAEELRSAAGKLRAKATLDSLHEHLCELLEHIADDMDDQDAIEGTGSKAVHPVSPFGLSAPRFDWTAALAVARVINGGEPS